MLGIGPSPLAMLLLIAVIVIWAKAFWNELRRNHVSWGALATLLAMLACWFVFVETSRFP
jgi:hypothetical protein